jgi:hypothetical protein
MATTTIRVDTATHSKLVELSKLAGTSLVDTMRDAVEALRRQRFARQVAREMARLREDETAWSAYLAEAEMTDIDDGIGR